MVFSLLDQFNLLHINDSIPQIANYAMFLTKQQEPERGISELQKLSGLRKIGSHQINGSKGFLYFGIIQTVIGMVFLDDAG